MNRIFFNYEVNIVMEKTQYLQFIERKYQKHFSVYNDFELFNMNFDIYAKFSEVGGRTFITHADVIDRYEVYEHCFVKSFNKLEINEVENFSEFLKALTINFVKPNKEHKSTKITGVLVSDEPISNEVVKLIESFKHTKYYKFLLQGYSDVRLLAVDLSNKKVFSNKVGKEVKKVFTPTP